MNRVFHKLVRLIALTVAIATVMALVGCVQTPASKDQTYSVYVKNGVGEPLKMCKVDIYDSGNMDAVIYTGITDKDGKVTFTVVASDRYVAVVSKQNPVYATEKSYPLTGEKTDIVLKPGSLTDELMDTMCFEEGSPMMDFSVNTQSGEVVLSQLLKEKKAVVLNFWFLNCNPCRMEFPYIQEGYEQLADQIGLLALNPCDGDDQSVAKFRDDNGYTFTMAKCDRRWEGMFQISAYPTTVVIDRYGYISLVHTGSISSTQDFLDLIQPFLADDYERSVS
jgi:thiol-disulfide isomerase/thioredoxin